MDNLPGAGCTGLLLRLLKALPYLFHIVPGSLVLRVSIQPCLPLVPVLLTHVFVEHGGKPLRGLLQYVMGGQVGLWHLAHRMMEAGFD